MKKRIGHKLLSLKIRLTPTQAKKREKRIKRRIEKDSYKEV